MYRGAEGKKTTRLRLRRCQVAKVKGVSSHHKSFCDGCELTMDAVGSQYRTRLSRRAYSCVFAHIILLTPPPSLHRIPLIGVSIADEFHIKGMQCVLEEIKTLIQIIAAGSMTATTVKRWLKHRRHLPSKQRQTRRCQCHQCPVHRPCRRLWNGRR